MEIAIMLSCESLRKNLPAGFVNAFACLALSRPPRTALSTALPFL